MPDDFTPIGGHDTGRLVLRIHRLEPRIRDARSRGGGFIRL